LCNCDTFTNQQSKAADIAIQWGRGMQDRIFIPTFHCAVCEPLTVLWGLWVTYLGLCTNSSLNEYHYNRIIASNNPKPII
jgi:hypothetical protein